MIRTVKRTWFEVWGETEAQNRFLKGLLAGALALCIAESVALTLLALRAPMIFAPSQERTTVLESKTPPKEILENELRRTITGFVHSHQTWDYTSIDTQLANASRYVSPNFIAKFAQANAQQANLAKSKKLSQRFHILDLTLDTSSRKARVTGDRIIVIDALRAANTVTLDIFFEYGPRTTTNPEGIYIVAEELAQKAATGR